MRLIRHGICRDVLLIGRWAIKVPTFRYGLTSFARGILANDSERSWSGMPGLCPVVWSLGGLVNIYPRCDPLPAIRAVEFDEDPTAYAEIAPDWPAPDRKPDNLGVLDGRIVWLDYDGSWNGCPHTRWAHDLTEAESA